MPQGMRPPDCEAAGEQGFPGGRLRHRRLPAGRGSIGDRPRPVRAMAMPQTDVGGLQILSFRTKSWRHTGACGPPADPFDGIPGWLEPLDRERPHSQWSGWLSLPRVLPGCQAGVEPKSRVVRRRTTRFFIRPVCAAWAAEHLG